LCSKPIIQAADYFMLRRHERRTSLLRPALAPSPAAKLALTFVNWPCMESNLRNDEWTGVAGAGSLGA
jgi:hypothetical protein